MRSTAPCGGSGGTNTTFKPTSLHRIRDRDVETSYPEAAVSEQPSQLSHRAEQGNTGINCSAVLAARARSSARAPLGHEDQHSLVCHAVLPPSFHSLQTIHRWTPFVAPHLGRNLRQRLLQQGGQPKLPAPAPPEAPPGSCNTSLTVLLHLFDVRSSLIQFSCCSKMPEISVAFLEQQQCWGCSKVCTGSRCGKGEQAAQLHLAAKHHVRPGLEAECQQQIQPTGTADACTTGTNGAA